jgi:transposase
VEIDGRKLGREAQERIRILAVRRVRAGERPSSVMKSYGLCRTTIYRWLRKARSGGEQRLRARKATGRPRRLTAAQEARVQRWLNGKDPRQYGFDFGLWTRRLVGQLVEERFDVKLSVTSIGRLLWRMGISPQKPLRRAYERDPVAVTKWVKEEFPRIRSRARRRRAMIFFLDEAGIRSDSSLGRTWAPRGQTPVVPVSGQRQAVNAISAVNERGGFWYATFTGRFNAGVFAGFLGKFLRHRRRPVFLIVDGHPAHRAKAVERFVLSTRGRLELYFLPGYSPDLNPDESVWAHIKTHGLSKRPLLRNESLRERVDSDLAAIRSRPALVRSFFRAPTVAYITH